jgi:tRNA pseudouridine38-40 synthase
VHWKENKGLIFFLIEADRFLHGMVRTIVGTVLHSFKNNFDESYIKDVLKSKNRESAGESSPSKGLFLYKVKY